MFRVSLLFPLTLAMACQAPGGPYETETETTEQALTTPPASDVIPEVVALVQGLSPATYRDIASSGSNYYVLTSTGIKRVSHSAASTIPTAATFKTINLNCIDYVNSTWNVVGARSKSGSTSAQLVLKIENSSPVTVNLPSDITTVYDMEAQVYSSSELEIWITVKITNQTTPVIREFRYNGSSLKTVQTITIDSGAKMGITARDRTYLVGVKANSGYPAFYKKYTSSPFTSLTENQQIHIYTHGDPGEYDPSPGYTDVIYSHGYDGTETGWLLYPDKIDFASYSGGVATYVMLVPTGLGTYDVVELPDSLVIFNKTPAREFSYWNDGEWVEGSNNCYNYSTNRNTMNYAQPGYGGGQTTPSYKPSDLKAAVIRDGLEFVADPGAGKFPTVPEGKSLVALITGLAPNYTADYHWYRKDRDGRWTHKPGPCEATDRYFPYSSIDAVVTDPRTKAAWDPTQYDTFVGFFLVDSNYFQGMGVENVNGFADKDISNCSGDSAAALSADSTSPSPQTASAGELSVTIALYSGRVNPVLVVKDAATIDKIRKAYGQAQALDGPSLGPKAGPGYMGLIVTNRCGISGLPPRFTLFNGQMTARAAGNAVATALGVAGATAYLQESEGSLESDLLDQAEAGRVIDSTTRSQIRTLNNK
jgi:hypothetical protein